MGIRELTRQVESHDGGGLPHGWRWAELQDVARLVAGASAPQGKDSFSVSGPCFVRVSDLAGCEFDRVVMATRDRLSELAIATKPLVRVPKGAVVLPKSGAAIATNRRAILGMNAYIVGHLLALIPIPEMILTEWLYFSLRQIDMVEHSENASYPSLKKSAVARIAIPLPPLAEQMRIVESLDGEIGAVEKARQAALDRVEAARALDSAFLREAFEFGDGELPSGWKWRALGDLCEVKRGKPITRKGITPGDIPVIAGGQQPAYYHNQANRTGETITVSGSGAYAGFVNFFDRPIFASDCSTLQAQGGNAQMMYIYMAMKWRQQDIYDLRLGSAQPHVYPKDVSKIEIPLPPLSKQRQIIATLNAKMAIAKQTRAAAEAELEAIEALPAALLRRAFRAPP